MCETCGCSGDKRGSHDNHGDGHDHPHPHPHPGDHKTSLELPTSILKANEEVAARTRLRLSERGILAVNVVGTPGAGKTALLESTLTKLPDGLRAGIIVGDLATENDARRLTRPGVPVVPIETGTGCHLTAFMIERALDQLPLDEINLLFVENVGNLVCPALFDLGEASKIALISVTEGTDKPEKYPVIVQHATLLLITKTDLLPHVDFDVEKACSLARRVHPEIEIMTLSARSGAGMDLWLSWLSEHHRANRSASGSRA